jgi:arginyl-tRNA synthetase
MDIFSFYTTHLHGALLTLLPQANLAKVTLEPPREAALGDLSTNAAMVLSKEAGINPKLLAETIKTEILKMPNVASVEIVGPGFINIRLAENIWPAFLESLLETQDYGRSNLGQKQKVNVEYVSANPTGPMHVGHGRGAVFGDALATLLDFAGFAVTKEYYINDAGAQVQVLGRSAYLRAREALGEGITIPEGLYPADYLVPIGQTLAAQYGQKLLTMPEEEWLPLCRDAAIDAMMVMIRDDLAKLNVQHDVFFSERSLHQPQDHVKTMLETLRAQGHIYEGVLPPPKGAVDEDYEAREQTLFRATAFGDDVDRPLLKSDGSYTYFASDIAYHTHKFQRGFTQQIDIWGADHGGYIKRVQAALKATTHGQATLEVKLCQLVRLLRNGEPVKMSKRSGDFVTLAEVVDEVGRDATRFMMLFRKNDATLDFDLAKVVEQSKDNPVFYVHYAHARCCSLLKAGIDLTQKPDFSLLTDEGERAIVRLLAQYPRIIAQAAMHHEPHRIAFYVHDLASALNSQYSRGKDEPSLRFIIDNDANISTTRLGLITAVRTVLKSGLALLGVEAREELR